MRLPEQLCGIKQASIATVAGFATATSLTACSPQEDYSQNVAKAINHTIVEPTCSGVRILQIDHDNFGVLPILHGSLEDTDNVVSYLSHDAATKPSQPTQLVNTSGGTVGGARAGVGVIIGLQGNIEQPVQLAIDDYQVTTPRVSSTVNYQSIEGVPTIVCPPADLGFLALQYFAESGSGVKAPAACVYNPQISQDSSACKALVPHDDPNINSPVTH